jgi:hypothetical protein
MLLGKAKPRQSEPGTWDIQLGGRLPVSEKTFHRIADLTSKAFSKPKVTPEGKALLDALGRSREPAAKLYRMLMLTVGLIGLAFGLLLLRDATPGNMQALPASIILLLACGALLNAVVPSRQIRGAAASEHGFSDRFKFEVTKAEPQTLRLTEADIERGAAVLGQGLPLEEAARAAYPAYDLLDQFGKQAMLGALKQSIKRRS